MPTCPDPAFDAHVHLQAFPATERSNILRRARAAGVTRFGCCGTQPGDWPDVLAIASDEPGVEPACGLHPCNCVRCDLPPDWMERLDAILSRHPGVSVGEIGLDARHPEHEAQRRTLIVQLDLAARHARDVALHVVRAHTELIEILRPYASRIPGILLHAASCSQEHWREYERLGARASIGPAVLSPQARRVRELARHIPEDRLCFETDAPDMAIHGCAIAELGGRNAPENLPLIVCAVNRLRGRPTPARGHDTPRPNPPSPPHEITS